MSSNPKTRSPSRRRRVAAPSVTPLQADLQNLVVELQDEINALIGETVRFVLAFDDENACENCKMFREKVEPRVRKIIRISQKMEKVGGGVG